MYAAPASKLQLRPYQVDLIDRIRFSAARHRRVCAQLPTGGGKTPILAEIVRSATERGKRSIVIAHRTELIQQAAQKLRDVGLVPSIIQGSTPPTPGSNVDVASIQTLGRRSVRLYDIVIIDEAHHAVAKTYADFVESQPIAKIIGLTATPCKSNGVGLHGAFDDLVLGPQPNELIDEGFLVPAQYYSIPSEELEQELSRVRTTGGDYNASDLGAAVTKSIIYGDLVTSYNSLAQGKRCLVFAVNVELSQRYADEYNAAGIPAAHIHGSTPAVERARIFADFAAGRLLVLTNCAIATEGVDIPAVEAVQIVRPTRSLPLYLQMVGRAVRPAPGKTHAIIIDHGSCHAAHGLPQEDRLWTLHGKVKRPASTVQIERVDIDLPETPERSGPDHLRAVQLVAIDPIDIELQRLMRIVDRDNLKRDDGKPDYRWAFNAWLKTLGRQPTREELKYVQRRCGYKPQWINHQLGSSQPQWLRDKINRTRRQSA